MSILTRLRELQQLCIESSNENFAEVFGAAADEIDRLNGVDKMDWISVDDRLPQSDCECLTFGSLGVTQSVYDFSYKKFQELLSNSDEGMENWRGIVFTVTHWMPLPKPPQENKK